MVVTLCTRDMAEAEFFCTTWLTGRRQERLQLRLSASSPSGQFVQEPLGLSSKLRGSRTVVRSKMFRNTKLEVDHPLCTESADAADGLFRRRNARRAHGMTECRASEKQAVMWKPRKKRPSQQATAGSYIEARVTPPCGTVAIFRFLVVLTFCSADSTHTLRVAEAPLLLSMLLRSNLARRQRYSRGDKVFSPYRRGARDWTSS